MFLKLLSEAQLPVTVCFMTCSSKAGIGALCHFVHQSSLWQQLGTDDWNPSFDTSGFSSVLDQLALSDDDFYDECCPEPSAR